MEVGVATTRPRSARKKIGRMVEDGELKPDGYQGVEKLRNFARLNFNSHGLESHQ